MDDFFFLTSRQRKRKRTFFHESLLEGATHFMKEENDQNDPTNEVSAELDTKLNGLCVSAKTGFKSW